MLFRSAPKCLAYGVIHFDREHIHMHIAITANNIREHRRHSLSKAAFRQIQKDVEAYRLREYPELGDNTYYDGRAERKKIEREKNFPRLTDREKAMKARTGELSRKERDHYLIKGIFANVKSEKQLLSNLQQAGFDIYIRGRSEGVQAADGRKYRLRTLGLEGSMLTARARIELFKDRIDDLERAQKNDRSNNRERP